jgi:tetratricopeptide (TPR) repeat protein
MRSDLSSSPSNLGLQAQAAMLHDQAAHWLRQGQPKQALQPVRQALALCPQHLPSMHLLGHLLGQLHQWQEARHWLEMALHGGVTGVAVHLDLAHVLRGQGLHEQALTHYDLFLSQQPAHWRARYNRANTLRDLDRHAQAVDDYRQVLSLQPGLAPAWANLGNALRDLDDLAAAQQAYQSAIAADPQLHAARYNLGLTQLQLGQWSEGWAHFEARWQMPDFSDQNLATPRPRWTAAAPGKSLCLWAEQGLGDEIFWAALLEQAHTMAEQVWVRIDPRLMPLLMRSFPQLHWVSKHESPQSLAFDTHLPLGSLGAVWRSRNEAFAQEPRPFLHADPQRVQRLRQILSPDGLPLCGVSWQSFNPRSGRHKSLTLTDLLPLLKTPGWRFVSLQYGEVKDECQRLQRLEGVDLQICEGIDCKDDLVGLTDLIGACDRVVSCSNSTIHLAGAMAKPSLLMLGRGRGHIWYWSNRSADRSLWYPSVSIEQMQPQDPGWQGVVLKAAAFLRGKEVG